MNKGPWRATICDCLSRVSGTWQPAVKLLELRVARPSLSLSVHFSPQCSLSCHYLVSLSFPITSFLSCISSVCENVISTVLTTVEDVGTTVQSSVLFSSLENNQKIPGQTRLERTSHLADGVV